MGDELLLRIVLFAVMAGSGLLLVWMARATASGRLGRNAIAGIRIPSTLASDEAWLAAHRRAERPTVLVGVAGIVGGLVAALLPLPTPVLVGILFAWCAVMLVVVLYAARVGSRAALRATQASDD
ncbi:SdpI family protein [Frigoribacterium salinisoli]